MASLILAHQYTHMHISARSSCKNLVASAADSSSRIRRVAGNWLFSGRRWRDPRAADDRAALEAGYDDLVAAFPAFSRCSRDRFLANVADICASWTCCTGEDIVPHNPRQSPSTPPQEVETAGDPGRHSLHAGGPRGACGDGSSAAAGEVRRALSSTMYVPAAPPPSLSMIVHLSVFICAHAARPTARADTGSGRLT